MNLFAARRCLLIGLAGLITACSEGPLPTIGRTHGDVPMSRLIAFDSQQKCYRFLENVAFEAPFADGMAYQQTTCLNAGKKIGRKIFIQLAEKKKKEKKKKNPKWS